MASILKVSNITGQDGGVSPPITLSGDTLSMTATLSSSSTVPASAGGSLVYLESTSGTAVSELKFENKFTDTSYLQYILEFHFKPTTDDRHIVGQFGHGGSSTTWITGSYRTTIAESYHGGSTGHHARQEVSHAFYTTGVGNATTDPGVNGTFYLIQPYVTGRYKMHRYNAQKWEQNDHLSNQSAGTIWYGGTNAITAMKFFAHDYTGGGNHGNITGELRMYALKGS
jgi:hypothetical protein